MPYKMRMRIAVDVDIEGIDSGNAFVRLDIMKLALRGTLSTTGVMDATRKVLEQSHCKIVDVKTDVILKEETWIDPHDAPSCI